MNGESLNITEEKLARLREVVPEAFAEGEIDWEKLRIALGGGDFQDERYHLNWAGKTGAFRALQSPTTATLAPCGGGGAFDETTGNIFIEGENLMVLKVLQKSYFGKIKMIYIDTPYNTGNDHFIYPDRFAESKSEYLKRIGDRDEAGRMTREGLFRKNSKENGHYHSNWLSMIYPRLFLARNLLSEDGVIFVSIDDNEMHNLRMVMNEIYGEENFVGDIIWNSTKSVTNTALISVSHTYNLVYARGIEYFVQNRSEFRMPETEEGFSNPDNDPRGSWKADPFQVGGERPNQRYEIKNPKTGVVYKPNPGCSWKNDFKKFKQLISDNRIIFGRTGKGGPQRKRFLSEAKERGRVAKTLWADVDTTANATTKLKSLMGGDYFTNPKPCDVIKRFCRLCTSGEDIVLDFFAGSCTTAHAVLDLNKEDGGNRKFICVQMPEECEEKTEAHKAGYKTIADIGKERIRRVIKNGKMNDGFKVFKLQESNFKEWRGDIKTKQELEKQMKLHTDPVADGAKTEDILYELLLKNGISLTAKMEDKGDWILVEDGELKIAIALDNIDDEMVNAIMTAKPSKFITLDKLFRKNDQLKTNIALQMEDAGVGCDVV